MRFTDEERQLLEASAKRFRRSVSAEIRLAAKLSFLTQTLAELQRPDAREHLGERWEETRAQVILDLGEIIGAITGEPKLVHVIADRLDQAANAHLN